MLPALTQQESIHTEVLAYLDALTQHGFEGDIETHYASRLAVATDNSVYQCIPQAVIFPKHTDDLIRIGQIGQAETHRSVTFSARGGGTGTNGQSLTLGVVVDVSRHMNQVLEINAEEKWVRVQSGVVKDQLNDALRPLGYFFSPDLSTSNRATIGGMINTDASGQGSLIYGKTSDHVLSLQAVLVDGSLLDTAPESVSTLKQTNDFASSLQEHALSIAATICRKYRPQILEKFPPLNRFLTGYDLKNSYSDETDQFDVTRLLCGAEGSLAFIAEAKLNITPIPTARTLVNIQYDSFDSALRNATMMVKAQALSVETIDSTVLDLAKKDIVWHTVSDVIKTIPNRVMAGINIVEFADQDIVNNQQKVTRLCEQLETMIANQQGGIIGYQVCDELASIEKVYAMRKKAVGLLGATKGARKPIAFAEDTCVPPENLADFIAEFRALLDQHQLHYGMFGHVDAGVLHVRPAFDLCDSEQEQTMKLISDHVVRLVAKYGGLMWGEHGKGFRSEYGPEFFGETLFEQLRRIKGAFDPDNRLNPGKICTPLESDAELVQVDGVKRGHYDRQIPIQMRESFRQAMECNGNGLCFNYDTRSPMCPSMKVMADRRHSPKGRAGLIREWLRLLSVQNIDVMQLETDIQERGFSLKHLIERSKNSWNKRKGEYDFSHEVMESMNLCLACKACATQCPIKVDVPNFRSRFMQMYYDRYQRPAKDYLVAYVEDYVPLMAKAPSVFNALMRPSWSQTLTEKTLGYVDMPLLSVPTLKTQLKEHHAQQFNLSWLQALSDTEREQYVLIVQDPFTSFYDAKVVSDFVRFIECIGKKPMLVPFAPNGKAQHIKGFLKKFAKTATNTATFLNQLQALNIPMVGIDPALVLCYRDEYNEILGEKRGDFSVLIAHEWLLPQLNNVPMRTSKEPIKPWYLFAHCTEKTKLPNAEKEWGVIFQHFGETLQTIPVGCCGMAGTFGHEKDKVTISKDIYHLSWLENLAELPTERCLVTGYSCRSQVKRWEKKTVLHPIQALLSVIE